MSAYGTKDIPIGWVIFEKSTKTGWLFSLHIQVLEDDFFAIFSEKTLKYLKRAQYDYCIIAKTKRIKIGLEI